MNALEEYERREKFIRQWKKDHGFLGFGLIACVMFVISIAATELEKGGYLHGIIGFTALLAAPALIYVAWKLYDIVLPLRAYKRNRRR